MGYLFYCVALRTGGRFASPAWRYEWCYKGSARQVFFCQDSPGVIRVQGCMLQGSALILTQELP